MFRSCSGIGFVIETWNDHGGHHVWGLKSLVEGDRKRQRSKGFFWGMKSMVIYLRCSTLCWCEQWFTVLYCILFLHFTSCLLTLELNFSTNLQRCSPLMASRFSHERFRFMNLLKLAVSIFRSPKMTMAETFPKRSINQTTFHLRVHVFLFYKLWSRVG